MSSIEKPIFSPGRISSRSKSSIERYILGPRCIGGLLQAKPGTGSVRSCGQGVERRRATAGARPLRSVTRPSGADARTPGPGRPRRRSPGLVAPPALLRAFAECSACFVAASSDSPSLTYNHLVLHLATHYHLTFRPPNKRRDVLQ